MKTFLLLLLALLLCGGAGWGGYYFYRQRALAAEAAKAVTPTAAVKKGKIRQTVSATGRVVSNLDVDIKCKASGEVMKLPFDVSDQVKKGDLLAELDPIDEQRQVAQAKAALQSSEAKLASAKQNLTVAELTLKTDRLKAQEQILSAEVKVQRASTKAKRFKETTLAGGTTQEECDDVQAEADSLKVDLDICRLRLEELKTQEAALELRRQDVNLAQAQVASDKIDLENAAQRLKDTTVLAPMDGAVAARNIQIGTIISSGVTNVGGGTTILTLSDLSRIFVLASVDESLIGQAAVGQKVTIGADAYPDVKFRGKVTRLATKGVNVSNVITFEVKIEVVSENRALLKPEMTTNVTVLIAEKDAALLVPAEALSRRQTGYVVKMVAEGGESQERPVQTGLRDDTQVEITQGLAEGDVVEVRKAGEDSKWRGGQNPPQMSPARMLGGGGPPAGGRGR